MNVVPIQKVVINRDAANGAAILPLIEYVGPGIDALAAILGIERKALQGISLVTLRRALMANSKLDSTELLNSVESL